MSISDQTQNRERIVWSTVSALLGLVLSVAAENAAAENARVPWTSSHFAGTPDPPPPYVAELAFPNLRFERPVLLIAPPGGGRLFVGEVAGRIVSFEPHPSARSADLVLDLAKHRPGFSALYGMAFHPRFPRNRSVYLCYVLQNDRPDGTRVSRFRMTDSDPPRIDPESETVLLTFFSGGHNGGCLAFGPDGMLYISAGDGAGPAPPDPLRTGQDLSDLLSSILRIDVDATDPGKSYRVPQDNPFVRLPGARPEIWAYGLRNPWKMSFDRATGDLWVGDVGWELWEMIYRVERGGNYGWSVREGRQTILAEGKMGPTPAIAPVVDHPHSEAASITGGYVYHGQRFKDLQGVYVYGDYQSGKVWGLRYDGRKVTWQSPLADTGLRLVAFGEGADGELYLVEHERTNQIYRLAPNPARDARSDFPRTLSQSGLFASTADNSPAPGVIPYAINAEAWADGTTAERWLGLPGTSAIEVDSAGHWTFPEGAVLAKSISIDLVAGEPKSRKRLETQVLHFEAGNWRPYTYIWNASQTDASLAESTGKSVSMSARDDRAPGGRREHLHRFAARSECILCHNPWVEARTTVFGRQTASPLAIGVEQWDRTGVGPCADENQIAALQRRKMLARPMAARQERRLVDPRDEAAGLERRARSYLQVNCAHCHQFNAGGAADIALSAVLPLDRTKTVNVRPNQGTFAITDARIIAPGAPERSVLYYRIAKTGAGRMPRIGSHDVDPIGLRLLGDWIASLPVLPTENSPGDDEQNARALSLVRDRSTGPKDRDDAIRRLLGTTRGALALVRLIAREELPGPALSAAVAMAHTLPQVEIRDLFERFLPDADRTRTLGDAIDVEALLAVPGDADRGRQWFRSDAAACKACHRLEGVGTAVGPDLSQVGTKLTKRALLGQILEPSREIDPKFATHVVATKSGRVVSGIVVERTDRAIVLRDAKSQAVSLDPAEVEQEITQTTSLMPEGLLRDLTARQAADLLAFLESLRQAGPVAP